MATTGDFTAPLAASGDDEDDDNGRIDGGITITNGNDGCLAISPAQSGDDDVGDGRFNGRFDGGIAIADGDDVVSLSTTCRVER